ncbi:MAG: hypothetical protein GY750_01825 [Lentisphaerae bacterium]|nr:hypothetical protein [Lentisphaerota bacterium]MCP4100160.1 hypothetical protein [Lentisphaerota bacterium]
MNFKKISCILIMFSLFINLSYAVELAGWINDTADMINKGFKKYADNNELFTEINPYWYNIGTSDYGDGAYKVDGSIYQRDVYNIDGQGASIVNKAHDNGTLVLPTIADGWIPDTTSGSQIEQIINNPEARQTLIDNLVNDAVKYNFDGWDLNFEASPIVDGRKTFPLFIEDLAIALDAKGKKLSVTIKCVNESDEGFELFDIEKIGQVSQVWRFKIMGFDNNFDKGADVPNAIAKYDWLDECLNYMIIEKGLPASKTQLGLHNFVRIWKKTGENSYQADSVNFRSYEWLREQYTGPLNWEDDTKESWVDFTYQNSTYRAYIGDAKTVSKRLRLLRHDKYGLAGLTFWVLEAEDDQIYQEIANWELSQTGG